MEINLSNIQPKDVGLNNLEIFYRPELIDETQGFNFLETDLTRGKQVVMGALVLMLNSPINEAFSSKIIFRNDCNVHNINALVEQLDVEATIFEREIQKIAANNSKYTKDDKILNEENIIDSYLIEVGDLFRTRKKIVL